MFAYASVFVIVSEKPAPEAALLPDLVQIVGQAVLLVETAADDVLDRAGGAVGKDHIHPIADCFEILQPLCIFFFGGKLLLPPGQVVEVLRCKGISFYSTSMQPRKRKENPSVFDSSL